ncbi:hypothetical protein D3C79_696960 [compost metagenome]
MGEGQALIPLLQVGEYGEQHQRQHHHQILDDKPADGDTPLLGIDLTPVLQRPQQHYGTGGGERQAEHDPGGDAPAEQLGEAEAEQGRQGYLDDGTRDGDVFDREQILQGEVQAHPEHQQDDADLRELGGQLQVGHIAGSKGTAHDSCRQITHHGGDPQALGQHAEDIGQHEAANQGCDKGERVVHVVTSLMAVRGYQVTAGVKRAAVNEQGAKETDVGRGKHNILGTTVAVSIEK